MKKTGITLTDGYENVLNMHLDEDNDVTIQVTTESFSFKNRAEVELFSKNVIDLLILAEKKD